MRATRFCSGGSSQLKTTPQDSKGKPDYELAWAITTPEILPELIYPDLLSGLAAMADMVGPLRIVRNNPLPHAVARGECLPVYILQFRDTLSIRVDGTWDGPDSICFYGPGGFGNTLDSCVESAIKEISYREGGIVVVPPRGIYGPVRGPAGVNLYGEPKAAIDRRDDLNLAMEHAIGRIPKDWRQHPKLEQETTQ